MAARPQRSLPPGPSPLSALSNVRRLRADALGFLGELEARYGGVVRFHLGPLSLVLVTDPDSVRHVLQENHKNYDKQTPGFDVVRELLGQGLLTSEGSFWLRQRRLAQPAFHRQRLAAFEQMMVSAAVELAEEWAGRAGAPFELTTDMMRLTLKVVGKALFGADLGPDAAEVDRALSYALDDATERITQPLRLPRWVPTPRNRRAKETLRTLDRIVYRLIERRRRGEDGRRDDLLGLLMEARDEDTGERMSDGQLRDEVMTLVLAGHETSANALSWAFALVSGHRDARARLEAELEEVLADRLPTLEDLPKLSYTRAVLDEALRLYPPAWSFSRRAEREDVVGGFRIPKGQILLMSPYLTHRDVELFENANHFQPERFLNGADKELPRFAYFPFGGGPRQCIGNNFALMEMTLVLAVLCQRFRLSLRPGAELVPDPLITLRPKNGLTVTATQRGDPTRARSDSPRALR